MLTTAEQALCAARPNAIAYTDIKALHYLGNYTRRLPISMARMMENAFDWEHLPYVHASSFKAIELVDSGSWGWRAKLDLPDASGGGEQLLDLLVDADRHYWATTVFSGMGEGVQIHTQATIVADREIDIDVRFYLPEKPEDEAAAFLLSYLQQQYATLYDEDEDLMTGRQAALDDAKSWRDTAPQSEEILVGQLDRLDRHSPHSVETATGRFCVRYWQDQWIAHNAVCPHLLGPLDNAHIDDNGHITCPWHDYRFDVISGDNVGTGDHGGKPCRGLGPAPRLTTRDGSLYLSDG